MKKFIVFICTVALTTLGWSQGRHGERIKAFKTGYLTQELDLSPSEAEQFWPIYNDFEKRIFELRVERRKEEREKIESMGGPEALSEKEAREFLANLLENEEDVLKSKKELYKSLDKILPPAKLLRLYKAESDFNRRLLSEFRRKGSMNRNN